MSEIGRVLLVGNEAEHLETYARVLRHFWSVNTVALDRGEIPELEADLVVVSVTLPEPERQEVIDQVRTLAPAMLVVRMNGFDSGPHLGADATVDEMHGPGALVSTIYELVTERGLGSRNWPAPVDFAWVQ